MVRAAAKNSATCSSSLTRRLSKLLEALDQTPPLPPRYELMRKHSRIQARTTTAISASSDDRFKWRQVRAAAPGWAARGSEPHRSVAR